MSSITRARAAVSSLAAAALTTAAVLACGAAPAHAAVTDVTCAGTVAVSYHPGLTLVAKPTAVQAHYLFSGCTGTDPSDTAGSADRSLTVTISCDTLETTGPGSLDILWSSGLTSTFDFNRLVSHVAGQTVVTFLGQISGGEFSGDSATLVATFPDLNVLDCLTTGVTGDVGVVTLEILTL